MKSNKCLSLFFWASVSACGAGKHIEVKPTPAGTENLPVAQPAEEPTSKSNSGSALNIDKLDFKKIDIKFAAKDVRIIKVIQDAKGDHYVALSADINGTGQAPDGFMILKLDPSGKEIWRWPTAPDFSAASTPSAEYRAGQLTDMSVSADGAVWLMGIDSVNAPSKPNRTGNPSQTITWEGAAFKQSNNIFFEQLDGNVTSQADLRVKIKDKIFSTPVWWTPTSIQALPDGTIQVESQSGSKENVRQIQRFTADLSTHKSSVCFIAPQQVAPGSDQKLITTRATQLTIDSMTANFPSDTAKTLLGTSDTAATEKQIRLEEGKCWDMLNTKVMSAVEKDYTIIKPLEGTSESVVRLNSQLDSPATGYQIVTNVSPSISDGSSMLPLADKISSTFGIAVALPTELGFVGIDKDGIRFGNAHADASKNWSVLLNTTLDRKPGSTSALVSDSSIVLAWLEIHATGEINQGNRYLRFAKMPVLKPQQQDVQFKDFELPTAAKTESTFSSVQLAKSKTGPMTVFVTAGSSSGDKAGDTALSGSLLLMATAK